MPNNNFADTFRRLILGLIGAPNNPNRPQLLQRLNTVLGDLDVNKDGKISFSETRNQSVLANYCENYSAERGTSFVGCINSHGVPPEYDFAERLLMSTVVNFDEYASMMPDGIERSAIRLALAFSQEQQIREINKEMQRAGITR
ncbi:MAG: hypothetical protein ACOYJ2_07695, partial [Rickettsiales bacterium]